LTSSSFTVIYYSKITLMPAVIEHEMHEDVWIRADNGSHFMTYDSRDPSVN